MKIEARTHSKIDLGSDRGFAESRIQRLAHESVERLATIEDHREAIEVLAMLQSRQLDKLQSGNSSRNADSFRTLRNLSLISYQDLSYLLDTIPMSEISVTELGRHVLKTLKTCDQRNNNA